MFVLPAWLAGKTIAEYVDKDSNGVQQGHGALVHARHEPYWKPMYAQSLCLPNASFPLRRTLHAISTAATMTDTTTRTTTTATTAPMIAPASLPGGAPPPAAGRSWDDVTTLVSWIAPASLPGGARPPVAGRSWDVVTTLVSRMDDSPATGSWPGFDVAARWDDATLLGETLLDSVIDVAVVEGLGASGATDVIDGTKLLVTSDTVRSKYNKNNGMKS